MYSVLVFIIFPYHMSDKVIRLGY